MPSFTLKTAIAAAAFSLFASVGANAAPTSDVKEFSNNNATEYFVKDDASKASSPYYRWASEDWSWTHNPIAGNSFTSIKLSISAYDVDSDQGEVDNIEVFDGSSWVDIGNLIGVNNTWSFAIFDLSTFGWAEAQLNAGLQVRMDIDANDGGWAVTLGKSVLDVNGGSQTCVPTPGVPCTNSVPEPGSLALLGLAISGLALTKRRKVRG